MPSYFNRQPDMSEKLVSAGCYLTGGILGLIYIIVGGRSREANFFRFHFLQAMLFSIMLMLINWALNFFVDTTTGIFGLAPGGETAVTGLSMGMSFVIMGLRYLAAAIAVAGIIQCLRGKFLEIPFVSNLVRSNMR